MKPFSKKRSVSCCEYCPVPHCWDEIGANQFGRMHEYVIESRQWVCRVQHSIVVLAVVLSASLHVDCHGTELQPVSRSTAVETRCVGQWGDPTQCKKHMQKAIHTL